VFRLTALEVSQKLLIGASLNASITEVAAMTGGREIVKAASTNRFADEAGTVPGRLVAQLRRGLQRL
jgi:hypothetical protein